jgi:hypothetical protein
MKGSVVVGSIAMALLGCLESSSEKMPPVHTPVVAVDKLDPSDGLQAFASEAFCRCQSTTTDRVATLSRRAPDELRSGDVTFQLCRYQAVQVEGDMNCLPVQDAGGFNSAGATYSASSEVTAVSSENVTVSFDTTYDDGRGRSTSGRGELSAQLDGVAQVKTRGGIIYTLRYSHGH